MQEAVQPQRRHRGALSRLRAATLLLPLLASLIGLQEGCRAEQQWPLWQHYRARFLDASGRIIDHTAGDRTTSEGQAYGLFFALVSNDRKSFNQMLRWTEDNLAGGDLTAHLPAWSWGKTTSGEWKPLDGNSAADADVWLAYDCLEAGRLWHDDRLTKLGSVLADRILHDEIALVPGVGTVLIPGPTGFHPAAAQWLLNPSYMPPQVVARLRQQMPDSSWSGVQQSMPTVLRAGNPEGYAMDWVSADAGAVHASPAPDVLALGKPGMPAYGSYDAVRVYLWLGMADKDTPGVAEALAGLPGMAKYLASAVTPPLRVESTGKIVDANGPVGFSAAVYPYLLTLGRQKEARAQMDRVDASLDTATGLYGHGGQYYDQNLVLFATGWKDGRFRFDRDGRVRVKWK